MKRVSKAGFLCLFSLVGFVGCPAQSVLFKKYFIYSGGNKNIKINQELLKDMERRGFIRIQMLYSSHIDSNDDGKFEMNNVFTNLNRIFPKRDTNAILVLDWEGKILNSLRQNLPNSVAFRSAVEEMASLLKIIHQSWPNLKVGYYGLPFRNIVGFDLEFLNKQYALAPIFENSDVIFPSIYLMRKESQKSRQSGNYHYSKMNTEFSLQLAKQYHLEVIPFIWHRYYPTIRKWGLTLIPATELQELIEGIRDATFEEQRVNGVVWWRSDNLFYDGEKDVLRKDARDRGGINNLLDSNTVQYSTIIEQALKQ